VSADVCAQGNGDKTFSLSGKSHFSTHADMAFIAG
jgi:hypothetical protein